MKELRIHPTTASHDLEVKARKARALLEKGHAVKLAVRMKGRENAFAGQASEKLGALAEGVCGENRRGEMKRSGREISCVLEP